MRAKAVVLMIMVLLMSLPAFAVEWNGKTGVGGRLGFTSPLMRGSNFSAPYEPFGMGVHFAADLKHGLTEKLVLNLTVGMTELVDDTTAEKNQSFVLNPDNNYMVLTGYSIGVTGNYYFFPERSYQPYVLAGIGLDLWSLEKDVADDTLKESFKFTDVNAKIGLGINYWLAEYLAVDLQAKITFGEGNLSSDEPTEFYTIGDWSAWNNRPFNAYFEPSIGVSFYFGGGKDTDQDGVKDKKDNCPGTPFGALVDMVGCPYDTDGDGVWDGIDMCAETPKGAKVDAKGCPLDADKDGVFDGLDQCPDTPEGVSVDAQGCPLDGDKDGVPDYLDKEPNTPVGAKVDADGVGIDSDNDGVYDGLDKCANTPAGAEVDPEGCPYDADQDGVADSVDACLGTPAGVIVDSTGCPLVAKIVEKIVLHVKFAPGSFEIDKQSMASLDSIAERIYAYPDTKVEIAGFTDNTGAEDFNLKLSEDRANAVKEYLATKGIAADRMTTTGYGENPDYFIDTNDTPEGRWNNRRVEINAIGEK